MKKLTTLMAAIGLLGCAGSANEMKIVSYPWDCEQESPYGACTRIGVEVNTVDPQEVDAKVHALCAEGARSVVSDTKDGKTFIQCNEQTNTPAERRELRRSRSIEVE